MCSFFLNDTETTEIYTYLNTLSLHDALPIYFNMFFCVPSISAFERGVPKLPPVAMRSAASSICSWSRRKCNANCAVRVSSPFIARSEEHTSELQSLMRISYAVFCLKKKTHNVSHTHLIVYHEHNKCDK